MRFDWCKTNLRTSCRGYKHEHCERCNITKAYQHGYETAQDDMPKTGAKIVPKEEYDMYITGYRDGHDDATKTARWIKGDDYVCDYCGYHMVVGGSVYNYCPSCGSRMLGEDGEKE